MLIVKIVKKSAEIWPIHFSICFSVLELPSRLKSVIRTCWSWKLGRFRYRKRLFWVSDRRSSWRQSWCSAWQVAGSSRSRRSQWKDPDSHQLRQQGLWGCRSLSPLVCGWIWQHCNSFVNHKNTYNSMSLGSQKATFWYFGWSQVIVWRFPSLKLIMFLQPKICKYITWHQLLCMVSMMMELCWGSVPTGN